ncbi:response regulator transcription factor [Mariprofundus aestuarium]|nr:response regulator [Mariprofundus aestuarium]
MATKKILIVDDNEEVRNLIFLSLNMMSYDLYQAGDSDQATSQFEKQLPDLVVLDIMLPGDKSGLDLCAEFKKNGKHNCKIILLSAMSQPADISKGYDAGADAYITKPFSPMALIREIHKLAR